MSAPLDLDTENDPFLKAIIKTAKQSLQSIYLGGASAATRYLKIDPPEIETILFDTEKDIELFIQENGPDEGYTMKCDPPYIQYPFAEKICFILTLKAFENSLCCDAEGIVVDVCSLLPVYIIRGSELALNNKIITLTEQSTLHPILFWKAIQFLCNFPDFSINLQNTDLKKMFFQETSSGVEEDDLFFPTPSNTSEFTPSFGSRLITMSLIKIAQMPYFPFDSLIDFIPYFNAFDHLSHYLQIDSGFVEESISAYRNFKINQSKANITLSPPTKIALLFLPIYSLLQQDKAQEMEKKRRKEKTNEERLLEKVPTPMAFDALTKLHVVESQRGRFMFWFLFCMYCFPTSFGFEVLSILFGYVKLNSTLNTFDKWAFVDGTKYWKEILAFMQPELYDQIMHKINNKPNAMTVLERAGHFVYSNNELAKAHGNSSMYKLNIEDLKIDFYYYLLDHPNSSFSDYVQYLKESPHRQIRSHFNR